MNDIREDLKAFLDGELSEARAAEVAAAIASDPTLAQETEFMKVLGFEIKRVAVEPESAGRALAVERARNAKPRVSWSPMTWPVAAQAVAGIACIAVLGTVFFPIFVQARNSDRNAEVAASYSGSPTADAAKQPVPLDGAPAEFQNRRKDNMEAGEGGGAGGLMAESSKSKSMNSPAVTKPEGGEFRGRDLPTMLDKEAKTSIPMSGAAASRLVVKNADLGIRVESASQAMQQAGTIAESLGGFVISSNSNDLKGMQPSGTVVMRVPAARFDTAMQRVRALGDVVSEGSNGEDVTAQVADIGARIKVLRAEEDSYITMLRAARRVNEMLEIKERLSMVRQEIESLTAQSASLKDLATLSTITASFEQKVTRIQPEDEPKGGFQETWNGAVNGLKSALRFLGEIAIVVFVYSPIWIPIVAIGWWLIRKNRRPMS